VPVAVIAILLGVVFQQMSPAKYCTSHDRGLCLHIEEGKTDTCSAGVLLQLTRQTQLGLEHYTLDEAFQFASETLSNGCKVAFSVECDSNSKSPKIVEKWSCPSGAGSQKDTSYPMKQNFQVCAMTGSTLTLSKSVLDVTFDIDIEAGSVVPGCIGLSAPSSYPKLQAVRGSPEDQKIAIKGAREGAGGCPTWRSEEERVARAEDFIAEYNPIFGLVLKSFLKWAKETELPKLVSGAYVSDKPKCGFDGIFYFVASMITGQAFKGATKSIPLLNCGEPMPALISVPGIQVTRHADLASLMADPHQRRLKIIGSGAEECCFDETLPVFMSAGSPEHTQVRRLWDAVGLDKMHLGDLPELTVKEPGVIISIRKKLMSTVLGINAPVLDELAPVVAPLFLEKLWGRKPTQQESDEIAEYGTMGGGCIMSPAVAKLPIVPGKILAVRQKALEFGRSSPVGKALARELEKPEYKELHDRYAQRPKGAVDTAIQNLADASLFAGLIGTSTLSMNCLMQVYRGPQFVKMFRENSTAFLYETMRTATAVAGSASATREPKKMTIWGEEYDIPTGTILSQMTGMAAGLDASVFPDPYKFDSSRPNLGETMNWNGVTKYVMARDYQNAPRFCPGAGLSVKIATKVCDYFSSHLSDK